MKKYIRSALSGKSHDFPEIDMVTIDVALHLPVLATTVSDMLDKFIYAVLDNPKIVGKFEIVNTDDLDYETHDEQESRYPVMYAVNDLGMCTLKVLLMFRISNHPDSESVTRKNYLKNKAQEESLLDNPAMQDRDYTSVIVDYSHCKSVRKPDPDDIVYDTYDEALQEFPGVLLDLWDKYSNNTETLYYKGYNISLFQHNQYYVHDHDDKHPEKSKFFNITHLRHGKTVKDVLQEIKKYIDSNPVLASSLVRIHLTNTDIMPFVSAIMKNVQDHFFYINNLKYTCVEAYTELTSNDICLLIVDSDHNYYNGVVPVQSVSDFKDNMQYYVDWISEDVIRCFQETYNFVRWATGK